MDEQYGFRLLDAAEIEQMSETARYGVDYGKYQEWGSWDILNLIATNRALQAELEAERERAERAISAALYAYHEVYRSDGGCIFCDREAPTYGDIEHAEDCDYPWLWEQELKRKGGTPEQPEDPTMHNT